MYQKVWTLELISHAVCMVLGGVGGLGMRSAVDGSDIKTVQGFWNVP